MIRYKGSRRACWEEGCGGLLAIVSFERNDPKEVQGKLRCLACGATSVVMGVNCERAPGAAIEEPPFPAWRTTGGMVHEASIFPGAAESVETSAPDDVVPDESDLPPKEAGQAAHRSTSTSLGPSVAEQSSGDLSDLEGLTVYDVEIDEGGDIQIPGLPPEVNDALNSAVDEFMQTIDSSRVLAQSPVKRWVGSKAQLLDEILPLVPTKFGTYYEPFLGSGAVAFALLGLRRDDAVSFERAVLSDTNERLIRAYRGIRDDVEAVIAELHVTKALYDADPETTYENARAMTYTDALIDWRLDARDDVTHAVWFLFVNAVCFNGVYRINSEGSYNVPIGKTGKTKKPLPFTFDEERLRNASALLLSSGVELKVSPWEGALPLGTATSADVCYLDPPYAALSETAEFGTKKGGYGNGDGFPHEQQVMLAGVAGGLAARGAVVIASNSSTMSVAYKAVGMETLAVDRKGTISSKGTGRGRVAEMLAYANTNRLIPGESDEDRAKRWASRPIRDEDMAIAAATINQPEFQDALAKARAADANTPQRKKMGKKKGELKESDIRVPAPTIVRITSNVKTRKMDEPWTLETAGSKILVVGENAAGKSRVLHAIELALSGRGTDVVLRDPALPAELLNLAPPGAGMLVSEVEFSDDTKATFVMPIAVVKGERKASRPTLGWDGSSAMPPMLPMRVLEEAVTGAADKARAFFLTAIENQTSDDDVKALLPALWHEMWTRATTGTRAQLTAPQKVLSVIETAREQQRKHKDEAKVATMLQEQLGERLHAGMPTDVQVQAAQERAADITAQLRELDDLARFASVVNARQQLLQARQAFASLPAPNVQAQKNHEVLSAMQLILQTAHDNDMSYCPLCTGLLSDETFVRASADLNALFQQQRDRNAEDDRNAQMRSNIEGDIRRLTPQAAEGVEIGATARASFLAMNEVERKAKRDTLLLEVAPANKAVQDLELLRARWNDVVGARDKVALAEREHSVWAQFEKSLVEARDALVRRAVQSFENRVNLFLPEGDRFGLRLNDDTGREVFQLGLWRFADGKKDGDEGPFSTESIFDAALSGAEELRVLVAVAAVLSERQGGPAVIIPRERMLTKKTLGRTLKALADAPGTIVLTAGENPGERATKGWYVIDVDAVVPSNGKHVDAGSEKTSEQTARDSSEGQQTILPPSILGGPLLGGILPSSDN